MAIRLSPLNNFQVPFVNPEGQEDYSYIVEGLQKRADEGKGLAFIDVVEGRFTSDGGTEGCNVDFVGEIWKGPLLKGGNYTYDRKNSGKQLKTMPMQMIERWLALADISLLTDLPARIQRAMN